MYIRRCHRTLHSCCSHVQFLQERNEERKEIESSGGETKQDARIIESVNSVKSIAENCEKNIKEFKVTQS